MLTCGRVSHTELHSQRELPGLSLSALKDCLYNFYCTGTLLFSLKKKKKTKQLQHFPVRDLDLINRVPLDKSPSSMVKKFKFLSIFVALFLHTSVCL